MATRHRQHLHGIARPTASRSRRGRPCRSGGDVLFVAGELDLATTPPLVERVVSDAAIRILDLSRVTFVDPFGFSALLRGVRSRRAPIEVRAPSAAVLRLLVLAGLSGDIARAGRADPGHEAS